MVDIVFPERFFFLVLDILHLPLTLTTKKAIKLLLLAKLLRLKLIGSMFQVYSDSAVQALYQRGTVCWCNNFSFNWFLERRFIIKLNEKYKWENVICFVLLVASRIFDCGSACQDFHGKVLHVYYYYHCAWFVVKVMRFNFWSCGCN